MKVLVEFKKFLFRGNVVDLAVAVVIGTAFTALVTALVADLLTPIIAAIFGKHDFSTLTFTINGSTFKYGAFINAVIAFLSAAAAVFFFVVVPVNRLMARYKPTAEEPAPVTDCPYCLSSIPAAATRCAFCSAELGEADLPAPRVPAP